MWISGYKLQRNVSPPYYVQEQIKLSVRKLAEEYELECSCSVHSEACYLTVHGKIISIRNHPGSNFDVGIQLADFNTWEECEKYFVANFLKAIEV